MVIKRAVTTQERFFEIGHASMGLTAQEGLQALIGQISGLPFSVGGKQQGNTGKQIRYKVRFLCQSDYCTTRPNDETEKRQRYFNEGRCII